MEKISDRTKETMQCGEKQFQYKGKHHGSASSSRRPYLASGLLCSLLLSLVLLSGTFLIKIPVLSIANLKFSNSPSLPVNHGFPTDQSEQEQCPQVNAILPPQTPALIEMDELLQSKKYQQHSTGLLSESITFQTVSYDNMSDPNLLLNDTLYEPFVRLFDDFISVSQHYHLDVVPVEEATIHTWFCNAAWKGKVADGKIWGRGAFDNKHTLVAILGSIEALLSAGFQPTRTVLLSFNFDEEIGGQKGAIELAKTIKQEYQDGVAVVIDEGSVQFPLWGADIVMIGVTEKDKMDLHVEIRTPGGHASQPRGAHTGIGIMSEIVVAIENHQYYTYLDDNNPLLGLLVCAQQHASGFPDILNPLLDDRLAGNVPPIDNDTLALKFVENAGPLRDPIRWSLTTAKSVTVIQGGSKSNSLPEQTTSWSDIRVHIGETTNATQKDLSGIIRPIAHRHKLKFYGFDERATTPGEWVNVSAGGIGEPAKISPFKFIPGTVTPWSIVAGTTRSILGEGITVVPGMSPGNTDARWYAKYGVSDYIYRYSPGATLVDSLNMHTVNETMSVKGHVNGVRWYSQFIRNMDVARFEGEGKEEEGDVV